MMHASTSSGIIWASPSVAIFLALALPNIEEKFQVTLWTIALLTSIFATIVIQWVRLRSEEDDDSRGN